MCLEMNHYICVQINGSCFLCHHGGRIDKGALTGCSEEYECEQ